MYVSVEFKQKRGNLLYEVVVLGSGIYIGICYRTKVMYFVFIV